MRHVQDLVPEERAEIDAWLAANDHADLYEWAVGSGYESRDGGASWTNAVGWPIDIETAAIIAMEAAGEFRWDFPGTMDEAVAEVPASNGS
jgi:hypothetical protein